MEINIKKTLWFDLETVAQTKSYDDLMSTNPRLANLWSKWQDKYKEINGEQTSSDVWLNKAALHAEYSKVVCASFGYYDTDMNIKMTSFYGHNESEILKKCMGVINNADKNGMYLGGHSIERFDLIFLWKRMIALGITPPPMINIWNKKPWELKFFDIAKMWSNGSYKDSFTSLDTMSAVLGVDTPKADLDGSMVHNTYWEEDDLEKIKKYCESDVRCTMEIANKLITTINKNEHESIMH